MFISETDKLPTQRSAGGGSGCCVEQAQGEKLTEYVRRVRTALGMSQAQLAHKAGIHLQSVGKIESGKTTRLNSKSLAGLSRALQISEEYLEAVCRGVPVTSVQHLKICPNCWTPGTQAEPMWLNPRSR